MALIHMINIKLNLGQVWLTYFTIYFVFTIIRWTNTKKDVIHLMLNDYANFSTKNTRLLNDNGRHCGSCKK